MEHYDQLREISIQRVNAANERHNDYIYDTLLKKSAEHIKYHTQ